MPSEVSWAFLFLGQGERTKKALKKPVPSSRIRLGMSEEPEDEQGSVAMSKEAKGRPKKHGNEQRARGMNEETQGQGPSAITIDPTQIQDPSQIPPAGSNYVGQSAQGLVDVYSGTLSGDIDAQPSAKELLGTAPDTGTLSNADYIYKQVSALYGGVELPDFQSPSGKSVKSLVFVSGSSQGGYGAFHIQGATQADFDRIVVDSLNAGGNYSAGSGLPNALMPLKARLPYLFPIHRGPAELLGVFHASDPRLKAAKPAAIEKALAITAQCSLALKTGFEARNAAVVPRAASSEEIDAPAKHGHAELARRLVEGNQNLLAILSATARAVAGRQYLSTALFAAEIVECFQTLTGKGDPGHTDGEAVSRVLAFKLAPEIALIPGFNGGVTQEWWADEHPDYVNDNTQNDQSADGNSAGVMFLGFLTDYLGVALDQILRAMPASGGAPLGQTYVALLSSFPQLAQIAGSDGTAAFQKMIELLEQNAQNADGSLNLPANGNPFPGMPGAKQGGLFAGTAAAPVPGSLGQDAQGVLGLQTQLEQQVASLRAALREIQGNILGEVGAAGGGAGVAADAMAAGGYGPPLAASLVASLERRAEPYRAPQYDKALQDEFWKHVYNELPGSGPHTDRLQVITGTNQAPLAVQITGTIRTLKLEPDGDGHIYFQPDDPNFPANQGAGEAPVEIEIIYAGPVTQADAKQAEAGFTNPFDISQLDAGTRMQAAGPLVFDRAHGKPAADGKNVNSGLEIHPLVGMNVLSAAGTAGRAAAAARAEESALSAELASALGQAGTLGQTVDNLTSLLQKMKEEVSKG